MPDKVISSVDEVTIRRSSPARQAAQWQGTPLRNRTSDGYC